jgi:hypothetical protein
MSATHDNAAAPAVSTDVLCVDCEYDLRGLPTDGRCPECGLEVQRSLDPMRFAEGRWLRLTGAGTILVLLGFLQPVYLNFRARYLTFWVEDMTAWAGAVFSLAAMAGVFMLTLPSGFLRADGQSGMLRQMLRAATLIAFGGRFLNQIGFALKNDQLVNLGWWAAAALAMELFFLAEYITLLARSLGSLRLRKHARQALWGLPVITLANHALNLMQGRNVIQGWPAVAIGILITVSSIVWVSILLIHCQVALARAHEQVKLRSEIPPTGGGSSL